MLPKNTSVGPVSLVVPDLKKSQRFYEDVLGFKTLAETATTLHLGASDDTPLLILTENKNGIKPNRRSPGLFHFAILFPTRSSLGKAAIHLSEAGWHLSGAGDHLVSEALYLEDPDGNGIELYADRPRETWKFQGGQVLMDTLSVDLQSIAADAKADPTPYTGLPAGTTMGHVHLKVANLEAAKHFYEDLIGFDEMTSMPQALFVAAGGYHHHLGLNTWMSSGSNPPAENSLGLLGFTINLPSNDDLAAIVARLTSSGVKVESTSNGAFVQDPSHNGVYLTVAA